MTPAMRLLIADRLRRTNRWALGFFALFEGFMWWAGGEFGHAGRAIGASMGIAFLAGPQTNLWLLPRAIWYLPASRREIWRAHWLIATVGVTLFTTSVKLIAMLLPTPEAAPLPFGTLMLSALFDFGAAGLGCALIIAATRPRPKGRGPHPAWGIPKAAAETMLPVTWMVMFYVPSWTSLQPPAGWSALTPLSSEVLLALISLAAATWLYVPTPVTPANRLTPAASRALTSPARLRSSPFSGMPRLLVREAGWVLAIAGGLALSGAVIVMVLAGVAPEQGSVRQFLHDALRVADTGAVSRGEIGYVAFNLLVAYAFFASAMATRFPLMLRHLRVLPLGSARLHALLVGWPAVIGITSWILGTALYYLVVGHTPTRPHLPTVFALIGVCALAQAVSLRMSTLERLMSTATFAGLVPFAGLVATPSPVTLAAIGIVSIAAAVALNRSALSRATTYRATPLPLAPTQFR